VRAVHWMVGARTTPLMGRRWSPPDGPNPGSSPHRGGVALVDEEEGAERQVSFPR
jgi:hypothetical protein